MHILWEALIEMHDPQKQCPRLWVSVATCELYYYELLEAFDPLRKYHAVYKQYAFRSVETRLMPLIMNDTGPPGKYVLGYFM